MAAEPMTANPPYRDDPDGERPDPRSDDPSAPDLTHLEAVARDLLRSLSSPSPATDASDPPGPPAPSGETEPVPEPAPVEVAEPFPFDRPAPFPEPERSPEPEPLHEPALFADQRPVAESVQGHQPDEPERPLFWSSDPPTPMPAPDEIAAWEGKAAPQTDPVVVPEPRAFYPEPERAPEPEPLPPPAWQSADPWQPAEHGSVTPEPPAPFAAREDPVPANPPPRRAQPRMSMEEAFARLQQLADWPMPDPKRPQTGQTIFQPERAPFAEPEPAPAPGPPAQPAETDALALLQALALQRGKPTEPTAPEAALLPHAASEFSLHGPEPIPNAGPAFQPEQRPRTSTFGAGIGQGAGRAARSMSAGVVAGFSAAANAARSLRDRMTEVPVDQQLARGARLWRRHQTAILQSAAGLGVGIVMFLLALVASMLMSTNRTTVSRTPVPQAQQEPQQPAQSEAPATPAPTAVAPAPQPAADINALRKAMADCDTAATRNPDGLYFLINPIVPITGTTSDWVLHGETYSMYLLVPTKDVLEGLAAGTINMSPEQFTLTLVDTITGTQRTWDPASGVTRFSQQAAGGVTRFRLGFDFAVNPGGGPHWSNEFQRQKGVCYWVNLMYRP